ncbi:hypothetical protein LHJMPILO_02022 [Aeromonas veronii]
MHSAMQPLPCPANLFITDWAMAQNLVPIKNPCHPINDTGRIDAASASALHGNLVLLYLAIEGSNPNPQRLCGQFLVAEPL